MNRRAVLIAFFFAGFTAMVYEIAWSRPLQVILGSTVYSTSTILAGMLSGFTLGSYLMARPSDRFRKPLAVFGLTETLIGVYGIVFISLITSQLSGVLPFAGYWELAISFVMVMLPALMMGAAWPLVNRAYIGNDEASDAAKLYSSNSFGSSLGPMAAGFLLIPFAGIFLTAVMAALINIAIGLFFIYSQGGLKDAF
ncbi:MAG: fused MFS/spermidine synthase [Candidatus Aenigmarchaeota archaeon]|nr:fused MFS/spermidine synthase [Candidatus Aenigmarchaeota archaeon]